MAKKTGNYSAEQVKALINGVPVVGLANGDDVIAIEYNADRAELDIGADGHGIRSVSSDNSAMVTIKLLYTSPTTDYLQEFLDADARTGADVFSLQIIDLNTGSEWFAQVAFISNRPPVSMGGKAPESRDFIIKTADLVFKNSGGTALNVA